ncbi:glycosyltransferase [Stratiformator vulcanicus]|uniref:Alpha-monoglucosyldiacylglycerol synthase n=1 Tax=Stratiformator vulcanicus TaxID=2527980 RepID=A0A517QVY4_9PLAN|nr:glycosyltransferase [Stratiformator vulcanicus]QDT35816.1 Alpha-monoglucosyldiacylglycerol synthase [Stratiformator vulcanicus]
MNILMLTNIYDPLVGGITESIHRFTDEYRRRGHRVVVVAPEFEGVVPGEETDVVRFPALFKAYKRRYSIPLPLPGLIAATLSEFDPDVIHSHHPFLIGRVAQRGASVWNVPLVYTHHSRYEIYAETEGLSQSVQRMLWGLTHSYCNACDAVVAPSESIRRDLRAHNVDSRIEIIPTGVDVEKFGAGDGSRVRKRFGVPADAFVVGHVGRIAKEKNCGFLGDAVSEFLQSTPDARFLCVGEGDALAEIQSIFRTAGLENRLVTPGRLSGQDLIDAYHAMDVFAFASQSETQGMVLTEAMAAGVPVVAVAASGVRDVMRDEVNGRMLQTEDRESFAAALRWVREAPADRLEKLSAGVAETAREFSIRTTAQRALDLYDLVVKRRTEKDAEQQWSAFDVLEAEWNAFSGNLEAIGKAILPKSRRTTE